MNTKDFFEKIEKTFNIDEKDLANLLDIDLKNYQKYKNGTLDTVIEKKLFAVFSLDKYPDNFKDMPKSLTIDISNKKFKNPLSIYTELLRVFKKKDDVYILTKFKVKNKISSFFDLFINNEKESVLKEMNNYNPSFLIECKENRIIVTISKDRLNVDIINTYKDTFVHGGYRYKKANKIEIK